MRRNTKGFTLVELLMVVIIIGILVTLAVPNYYRAVERSKGAKAKANLDMIRKAELHYRALEDFYTDNAGLELTAVDFDDSNITADTDWSYSIATAAGGAGVPPTFTATANRLTGGNANETITLTDTGVLTPSANVPEWD